MAKIKNNTDKEIGLFFGNPEDEEPEAVVKLKIGSYLELVGLNQDISIQNL